MNSFVGGKKTQKKRKKRSKNSRRIQAAISLQVQRAQPHCARLIRKRSIFAWKLNFPGKLLWTPIWILRFRGSSREHFNSIWRIINWLRTTSALICFIFWTIECEVLHHSIASLCTALHRGMDRPSWLMIWIDKFTCWSALTMRDILSRRGWLKWLNSCNNCYSCEASATQAQDI